MNVQLIAIKSEADVVTVCTQARRRATTHHLSPADVSRFETAASELAWNIVKYAGSGTCLFFSSQGDAEQKICATFEDHGPGIPDLELAMQDGFTTGKGLGGGLPGVKRLVDTFHIASEPAYTVISIGLRVRRLME